MLAGRATTYTTHSSYMKVLILEGTTYTANCAWALVQDIIQNT